MEQPHYLIDTNAVIDYLGNKLPASGMGFMNMIVDAVSNVRSFPKLKCLALILQKSTSAFTDDTIVLGYE